MVSVKMTLVQWQGSSNSAVSHKLQFTNKMVQMLAKQSLFHLLPSSLRALFHDLLYIYFRNHDKLGKLGKAWQLW